MARKRGNPNGNPQNLTTFRDRKEKDPEAFREFQREMGRRGAAAIKKKKSMREDMRKIMELAPTDEKLVKEAMKKGLISEDITNQMVMLLALYKRAIKGDVYAVKEIRDILGEETQQEDREIEIKLVLASEE